MTGLISAVAPILMMIVKSLLELFVEKANEPTTVTDAVSDPDLNERLRSRVRRAKSSHRTSR